MSEIRLQLKQRKEYLLIIIAIFGGGFLIYASLAAYGIKYGQFDSPIPAFAYGIMGGYMFASIASGIIIFIKKTALWLKVVCGILFFPIFVLIYLGGAITLIPYFICNLVCWVVDDKKLKSMKTEGKRTLSGEVIEKLMETDVKIVEYNDIFEKLKFYTILNYKTYGVSGGLILLGIVFLLVQVGVVFNIIGFILVQTGFIYLGLRKVYPFMRERDTYCKGVFYMGCDEDLFGIFHEEKGLVRKPLGKYRMLESVKMNQVNAFIYNEDRKILIVYSV